MSKGRGMGGQTARWKQEGEEGNSNEDGRRGVASARNNYSYSVVSQPIEITESVKIKQ